MVSAEKVKDNDYWLQDIIVAALEIGISKKELMNEYYFDEISIIFDRYNVMHKIDKKEDNEEEEAYWDSMF